MIEQVILFSPSPFEFRAGQYEIFSIVMDYEFSMAILSFLASWSIIGHVCVVCQVCGEKRLVSLLSNLALPFCLKSDRFRLWLILG